MEDLRVDLEEERVDKPLALLDESSSDDGASFTGSPKNNKMKQVIVELPELKNSVLETNFPSEILPFEIWIQIFSYTHASSFYLLLSVCQYWNQIILSKNFLKQVQEKIHEEEGIMLLGEPSREWITPIWGKRIQFLIHFEMKIFFESNLEINLKEFFGKKLRKNRISFKLFYQRKIFQIDFQVDFGGINNPNLFKKDTRDRILFFYDYKRDISDFTAEVIRRRKKFDFIFFIELEKRDDKKEDVWPVDVKNDWFDATVFWFDQSSLSNKIEPKNMEKMFELIIDKEINIQKRVKIDERNKQIANCCESTGRFLFGFLLGILVFPFVLVWDCGRDLIDIWIETLSAPPATVVWIVSKTQILGIYGIFSHLKKELTKPNYKPVFPAIWCVF